jgi:uncharacterized membrane protein
LLCYFIPALSTPSILYQERIPVYTPSPRYLLASLVLTLQHQFCCIKKLGSKAIIMFLAGTLGIILGGPWYIYVQHLS